MSKVARLAAILLALSLTANCFASEEFSFTAVKCARPLPLSATIFFSQQALALPTVQSVPTGRPSAIFLRQREASLRLVRPAIKWAFLSAGVMTAMAFVAHIKVNHSMEKRSAEVQEAPWLTRALIAFYMRMIDRFVVATGVENVPEKGSYVVVCNHPYLSGIDLGIIATFIATHRGRISKILMTDDDRPFLVDFLRWCLVNLQIAILVPSENLNEKGAFVESVVKMVNANTNGPMVIFISPKGEHHPDAIEQLEGWKTGAARIAKGCNLPIIPVGFSGPEKDPTIIGLLFDVFFGRFKKVGLAFGKPIQPLENDAAITTLHANYVVGNLMNDSNAILSEGRLRRAA